MASQKKLKDGFYELLKKENYSKGNYAVMEKLVQLNFISFWGMELKLMKF